VVTYISVQEENHVSTPAVAAKPAEAAAAPDAAAVVVPEKAGLVLATLIIVAAVANLPLAMANVALPSIGVYFDASQTQLNLVAVAYSLRWCSSARSSSRSTSCR